MINMERGRGARPKTNTGNNQGRGQGPHSRGRGRHYKQYNQWSTPAKRSTDVEHSNKYNYEMPETTDEQLARILQEEETKLLEIEDHFLAEQGQEGTDGCSNKLNAFEARRPSLVDRKVDPVDDKKPSACSVAERVPAGDSAALLQEQADLELALELAQVDMEKTGRDYMREVHKYSGRGRHKQGHFGQEANRQGYGQQSYKQQQQTFNRGQHRHGMQRPRHLDAGPGNMHDAAGATLQPNTTGTVGQPSSDLTAPLEMLMLFHPFMTDEEWDLNMLNNQQGGVLQELDGPGTFHSSLVTNGDREFSENDYEALLDLAEQLGEVKERGLKQQKIRRLPTRTFIKSQNQQQCCDIKPNVEKEDGSNLEVADCKICLTTFEHGDFLRHLPCGHEYHDECIDKWLKRNAVCPVCRKEVK